MSINPIRWSVILDKETQIVVGHLAGSIQAITVPAELTESDRRLLEEWRELAENMLYRIALMLDGHNLDTVRLSWMMEVLSDHGRKVFYHGAGIGSTEILVHWFVMCDGLGSRRVAWTDTIHGESVLTICKHESDFDFIHVLKRMICPS